MNTTAVHQQRTLVLGATGKTGSRVASRLQQLNWPIRIGSRSAAIPFDWYDDGTWDAALDGMEAVYISFVPDLCVPGAVDLIGQFASRAVAKGAQKLVMLSGRGELEALACEQQVIAAGADCTIVRASWFMQNFSEGNFIDQVLSGYVALPAGAVKEPFIDADDIADVSVAALTQTGHSNKIYEVTGPRAMTFAEAVAEIAQATDRVIHYEQISIEAYSEMLRQYQVPEEYVRLLAYLFGEVLDGRNAQATDGVEQALGRAATDFKEYVRKTHQAGAWAKMAAQ